MRQLLAIKVDPKTSPSLIRKEPEQERVEKANQVLLSRRAGVKSTSYFLQARTRSKVEVSGGAGLQDVNQELGVEGMCQSPDSQHPKLVELQKRVTVKKPNRDAR